MGEIKFCAIPSEPGLPGQALGGWGGIYSSRFVIGTHPIVEARAPRPVAELGICGWYATYKKIKTNTQYDGQ